MEKSSKQLGIRRTQLQGTQEAESPHFLLLFFLSPFLILCLPVKCCAFRVLSFTKHIAAALVCKPERELFLLGCKCGTLPSEDFMGDLKLP